MDVMMADMFVEATEELHRPGLRYTNLLIFFRLECSSFVDNCCSNLIECDIFRSVGENAPVVGIGNGISEFSWVCSQRRLGIGVSMAYCLVLFFGSLVLCFVFV